jgi:hypothetical protein
MFAATSFGSRVAGAAAYGCVIGVVFLIGPLIASTDLPPGRDGQAVCKPLTDFAEIEPREGDCMGAMARP